MMRFLILLAAAVAFAQNRPPAAECACASAEAAAANRDGIAAHSLRSLAEASAAYTRALRSAPAREPSSVERDLILRLTPRVYTTVNDPFPLIDAAAILHPDRPWIAYHFFWEDDIDFPDDNDPCDHELMWVQLDPQRTRVAAYYTYFHGQILSAPRESLDDSANNGGRPAVVVQWGKHGTMPLHWRALPAGAATLESYNRATWQKLATTGRDAQSSPLARGWPVKFPGSFGDFTSFAKFVDPADLLRKKGYMSVSCLNNAVINRHFLRYNFSAKTEWPAEICGK